MTNTPPSAPKRRPRRLLILQLAIGLQALCALFFVGDVLLDLAGLDPDNNTALHNGVELVAVIALVLGIALMGREMRLILARQSHMADQLDVASGAFHDLLESRFDDWALTPAERDVALMLIKGLSLAEIAELRQSAEGTVKAHCNKVYAKARVSGRTHLVSLFIEDLMADGLPQSA